MIKTVAFGSGDIKFPYRPMYNALSTIDCWNCLLAQILCSTVYYKVMSYYQLDHRLLPVQFNCWLCSHRPGEVSFTSRNSFRSHLVFVHSSDITRRRCNTDQGYEDVIVQLEPQELAAKRRKFQLRTASPAERRAIYNIEQKRQIINIMPRYIPSLSSQVPVGGYAEEDEEKNQVLVEKKVEGAKVRKQDQEKLTSSEVLVELGEEEGDCTKQHQESQRMADAETVSMGDDQKRSQPQEEMQKEDREQKRSQVLADLSSEGQSIDKKKKKLELGPTEVQSAADNRIALVNIQLSNAAETDWSEEDVLVSMLPELNNDNQEIEVANKPEQYRVLTPVIPDIQETVAESVFTVADNAEMMDISVGLPPPEMFADVIACQAADRSDTTDRREDLIVTDMTDRREDLNSIDNVIENDDCPMDNAAFVNFARSVSIPTFDVQVNALLQQISAETFVFQDVPADKLADRIAANSAILANSEIRRLTQMSVVACKNMAESLLKKLNMTARVTPDANVVLASLMSELAAVANRPL